jgi:MFS transporter, MHS family, shikimate and dehydroshikimate transport protein
MDGGPEEAKLQGRSLTKVALTSLVATSIEWYDFFLYGTAAALIFPQVFFPEASPLIGTLLAFSTFGVGFVFRPVGGLLFGQMGDRIGRKRTLVIALLLMGLASTLIGLLPTYAAIGIVAPVLLTVMRVCQGLALGGQWGGAMLLVTENAPANRRGYYGSFAQLGVPVGLVCANLIFLGVTAVVSPEALIAWGWRVPFLVSVLLIAIAIYVGLRLEETLAFQQVRESRVETRRLPVLDVFRLHPKEIALAAGAQTAITGTYYVMTAYILSYGTDQVGASRTTMLVAVLLSSIVTIPALVFFAWVSDRIGRRGIFMWGAALTAIWSFPAFWLINTGTAILILVALVIYQVVFSMMYGPTAALFAEMFGTRIRYSGASIGYQLGGMLGGALAPIIATSLFAATGTSVSIAAYMAAVSLIGLVAVFLATETYQKDMVEELD